MTQKRLPTAAQLKEMAQINIHTVEKESLVSAEGVQIHTELSDREDWKIISGRLKIRIVICQMG